MRWSRATGLIALTIAVSACTPNAGPPPPENEIVAMMQQPDAIVLDVRSTSEFERGHVPGATNVPIDAIASAVDVLGANKARPVVVHCAAGVRSARAASALAAMGYTNVLDAKTPVAVANALGVALE